MRIYRVKLMSCPVCGAQVGRVPSFDRTVDLVDAPGTKSKSINVDLDNLDLHICRAKSSSAPGTPR